jgi:hypothetical protein
VSRVDTYQLPGHGEMTGAEEDTQLELRTRHCQAGRRGLRMHLRAIFCTALAVDGWPRLDTDVGCKTVLAEWPFSSLCAVGWLQVEARCSAMYL